ncbi:hypothetical protein D9Q98_003818 [Chlorella vulgaris]|uniref:ENTH domain-containing protein n=1 Tax=Chlorella vulgaris TaxID=3077 RepID=A0A9D4TRZ9_CHLVU|nr:hypothetical protein D9Q98_003818 [Chlorella vulgaris]
MASWIDWAKTKLLVEQATSHNDDPTPIYVLDEVVAALAGGDSRAGVDAVIARLGHRSPIVKRKALKLVAHIGRKGSPDLRRLLSRQSGAVRDLQHFRCDPDPFTGDAVWRRVQESAQDALNAIHAAPEAVATPHSTLGGRIQGFGSDAAGGGGGSRRGFGSDAVGGSSSVGGGGGGGGSGRMVGFGSADAVQSGMQAVSSGMRSLGGKAGGLLRQDGYSSSQLDGGSSYGGSTSRQGAALTQPIMQAGGPPLAAASSNSAGLAAAAGGGRPLGGGGSASSSAAEAAAEAKLVDRLCAPAGLRAAPSREDLQAFVAAVSALDGLAVARLLEQKLEAAAPWQSTLRALCAIEAVVEGGSSTACGQLAVHFQTRPEAVAKAAESPQASVRQRAQKLLALLGGDGGSQSGGGITAAAGTAHQQQQQQQQPLFTEDLLGEAEPAAGLDLLQDLAGPSPAPPSASSTAAAAAPTAAAPVDLMAGLSMATSPGPAPAVVVQQPDGALGGGGPAAAADPFAGMLLTCDMSAVPGGTAGQAGSSLSPQPPAASPLDLLGGLSFQAAPGAAAPRMAAPQAAFSAAPQQLGDLGDLLGGLSVSPAQPAGVPLGSGFQQQPMQQQPMQQPSYQPFGGGIASGAMPSLGLGLQQQSPMHMPLSGPFSGQAAMLRQQQQAAGYQPHGSWSSGSGSSLGHGSTAAFGTPASAVQQHAGMGRLGSSNGVQHGRQASGGGDALCKLNSSGIVDTPNSFNFVDDAIAAARRKQ